MIRIYKGNDVKYVTNGVYINLYKPLGYKPVVEEKPNNKITTPVAKKPVSKENKESVSVKKTKKGE